MSKIEEIEDESVDAQAPAGVSQVSDGSDAGDGADAAEGVLEDGSSSALQSKAEQKARKMLLKEGLKQMPGISRVTLRRAKNMLFVIDSPDVYKSPNSDCYIVFGEVKVEDLTAKAQAQAAAMAAQQAAQEKEAGSGADGSAGADGSSSSATASAGESSKKAVDEDEDEGEVDETGVEAKDIELVVEQAGCSRAKAVKALKASNGDIVNAIMEITM